MSARDEMHIPAPPRPPKLPARLEALDASALQLAGRHEELESVVVSGAAEEPLRLDGASWTHVALRGARLGGLDVTHATWTDVEVERCDLSNARAARSSIRRLAARGSRLVGAGFGEARLEDATFDECSLEMANLRFAELERVVLRDCQLCDADFANARLRSVRFERCDLSRVDLNAATFERCTMEACTLDDAKGIARLDGVTMRWSDVVALAPVFAAALGVRVTDDPGAA